jgi:hypothetical protein
VPAEQPSTTQVEEAMMPKYMLLIYGASEGGPPPEAIADHMQEWYAYTQSLQDAGVRVADHQLHGVETATTVRVRGGETQIIDGPFAATKEYLGGYYLIDCPDLDTALAHAARCPIVSYGSVEVRPIMDDPAAPRYDQQRPA